MNDENNGDNSLPMKPHRCPDCGNLMGWLLTDGSLVAGGVIVVEGPMLCVSCFYREYWHRTGRTDALTELRRATSGSLSLLT